MRRSSFKILKAAFRDLKKKNGRNVPIPNPGLEWVQRTRSKPSTFLKLMAIREGSSDPSLGSILYLETSKKKMEIANAPEYSLLGGGILTFAFLFFVIQRKESPAQRARANCFFDVF